MELRPGYKQTEVGVIPEEWEVKPLGTLLDIVTDCNARPAEFVQTRRSLREHQGVQSRFVDLSICQAYRRVSILNC